MTHLWRRESIPEFLHWGSIGSASKVEDGENRGRGREAAVRGVITRYGFSRVGPVNETMETKTMNTFSLCSNRR
jgi:hypothetical protein